MDLHPELLQMWRRHALREYGLPQHGHSWSIYQPPPEAYNQHLDPIGYQAGLLDQDFDLHNLPPLQQPQDQLFPEASPSGGESAHIGRSPDSPNMWGNLYGTSFLDQAQPAQLHIATSSPIFLVQRSPTSASSSGVARSGMGSARQTTPPPRRLGAHSGQHPLERSQVSISQRQQRGSRSGRQASDFSAAGSPQTSLAGPSKRTRDTGDDSSDHITWQTLLDHSIQQCPPFYVGRAIHTAGNKFLPSS